jgi:hypothetical protein
VDDRLHVNLQRRDATTELVFELAKAHDLILLVDAIELWLGTACERANRLLVRSRRSHARRRRLSSERVWTLLLGHGLSLYPGSRDSPTFSEVRLTRS